MHPVSDLKFGFRHFLPWSLLETLRVMAAKFYLLLQGYEVETGELKSECRNEKQDHFTRLSSILLRTTGKFYLLPSLYAGTGCGVLHIAQYFKVPVTVSCKSSKCAG